MHARQRLVLAALLVALSWPVGLSLATRIPTSTTPSGRSQAFQSPMVCAQCHPRQFHELRQAVHAGYRNASPTFNSLELGGNALVQSALSAGTIQNNLRPVYMDNPRPGVNNRNVVFPLEQLLQSRDQLRAGLCLGCHNGVALDLGQNPAFREVPQWDGVLQGMVLVPRDPTNPDSVNSIRPLRDFHLVAGDGCEPFGLKGMDDCTQVFPEAFGGPPPPGALPSLGAAGITCDHCHNVYGPDHARSLQGDGFADIGQVWALTEVKVGPFLAAMPVRGKFHTPSFDLGKINYLRSSNFCGACHDVRIPNPDVVAPDLLTHTQTEANPQGVGHYRLENLSTEHFIGPYNSTDNPFGKVIRCQDCHMSLFPYAGETSYTVQDSARNRTFQVTSPIPAIFPTNTAAVANAAEPGYIPPLRTVATHYFTGCDMPLLSDDELRAHLGPDYPLVNEPGVDEYGTPLAISQRREGLLKAAVRVNLDLTDQEAHLGGTFHARVTAVSLTGHRFPAGFSQERTTYIQLTVSAKRRGTDEDFILYQSGYVTDKPHPETGELAPDGNLNDEDVEHINAIVNPFTHSNEVFFQGPDNGPEARDFTGAQIGLVLFRNEVLHVYDAGQPHPRTGAPLGQAYEEETFSAAFANTVDNWHSLAPLVPRTFTYALKLPSAAELHELGVDLEGALRVKAVVNFNHFPPLFLRFLARATGAVVEQNLYNVRAIAPFVGLQGVANLNFNLFDEKRIDDHLRNVLDLDTAERSVPLF